MIKFLKKMREVFLCYALSRISDLDQQLVFPGAFKGDQAFGGRMAQSVFKEIIHDLFQTMEIERHRGLSRLKRHLKTEVLRVGLDLIQFGLSLQFHLKVDGLRLDKEICLLKRIEQEYFI